jgi:hypothetical protein
MQRRSVNKMWRWMESRCESATLYDRCRLGQGLKRHVLLRSTSSNPRPRQRRLAPVLRLPLLEQSTDGPARAVLPTPTHELSRASPWTMYVDPILPGLHTADADKQNQAQHDPYAMFPAVCRRGGGLIRRRVWHAMLLRQRYRERCSPVCGLQHGLRSKAQ